MKGPISVVPSNNAHLLSLELLDDGSLELIATFSPRQVSRGKLPNKRALQNILHGRERITDFRDGNGLLRVVRHRSFWKFGEPSEVSFYFDHSKDQPDLVVVKWTDLKAAQVKLTS